MAPVLCEGKSGRLWQALVASTRASSDRLTPLQKPLNPALGKKNASNDAPSRVALIGAQGYTGQAFVDLLDKHLYMDLRQVSSRELAGQELQAYACTIIYKHFSP